MPSQAYVILRRRKAPSRRTRHLSAAPQLSYAGMTTGGAAGYPRFTWGGPAMDFADSPEHAQFRREFRDWLEANLPEDLKVEDAQDQRISPDREILVKRIAWQKKMHEAGWVGISWPKEYGGRGANFMQQVIWDEEYFRARAPILPCQSGLNLLGPTLIHWGNEEQKKRHLPRILGADEIWCQGYSRSEERR